MNDPGRNPVVGRAVQSSTAATTAPVLRTDCAGCDRVRSALAGTHPFFVAELSESLLFVHDDQRYTGHCMLFLKSHADHLHELTVATQARLAEDVARAARAIVAIHHPKRLNYECLGNGLPHIHWHVIPRYEWDPEPKSVIWVRPPEERFTGAEPVALAALVAKMRETLSAQTAKSP